MSQYDAIQKDSLQDIKTQQQQTRFIEQLQANLASIDFSQFAQQNQKAKMDADQDKKDIEQKIEQKQQKTVHQGEGEHLKGFMQNIWGNIKQKFTRHGDQTQTEKRIQHLEQVENSQQHAYDQKAQKDQKDQKMQEQQKTGPGEQNQNIQEQTVKYTKLQKKNFIKENKKIKQAQQRVQKERPQSASFSFAKHSFDHNNKLSQQQKNNIKSNNNIGKRKNSLNKNQLPAEDEECKTSYANAPAEREMSNPIESQASSDLNDLQYKIECPDCQQPVMMSHLQDHLYTECIMISKAKIINCWHCGTKVPEHLIRDHNMVCKPQQQKELLEYQEEQRKRNLKAGKKEPKQNDKKLNSKPNPKQQNEDIEYFILPPRLLSQKSMKEQPKGLSENQISQLTEINIDGAEKLSQLETKQCHICYMEYDINDRLLMLPCLHNFHGQCVEYWFKDNSKCPVCKSDLHDSLL